MWILLLFCAFLSGSFRMGQAVRQWRYLEDGCPEDGAPVCLRGQVTDIRKTTWSDAVEIKTERYGQVLVYAEPSEASLSAEELRIGQWIQAEGEAGRFEPARNPGQFDFKEYYRSQGISMSLSAERLSAAAGPAGPVLPPALSAESEGYSPYLDGLYRLRRRCSRILEEICEEADRGIFQAVILGEKEGMDPQIRDLYQENGISHMLAISGLHLSIIGMGLYRLLRKAGMGYGLAGGLAGTVIVSYGVMTGGSGSAVRAMIMLLMSFLASYLGRTYDLLSALSLAALLLAWSHPFLIGQSGFQLSFGAVLGIGLLGEQLNRILKADKNWKKTLLISLSIQLMTCPVVLYHYYQYPVYGILLNLAAVPLMGYVVLSGLLGIGAGCLLPALGTAAVGSGHYILQMFQLLCRMAARLPGGQAVFGRPRWSQIFVYYGILAAVVLGMKNVTESGGNAVHKKGSAFGLLLIGTACCFFCLRPLPQTGCDTVFLDVGQGDGIVIRCEGGALQLFGLEPGGGELSRESSGRSDQPEYQSKTKDSGRAVILVDGGSTSERKLGENRLEPYLKFQGIQAIDLAVVSHGDEDHISGLRYLLEECGEIAVSHLILPGQGRGDSGYQRLIEAAGRRGTQVWYMDAGAWVRAGSCELRCLYPQKGEEIDASDRNQQSLIVQADYGSFHMLLTGDADEEGERRLAERHGRRLAAIQVLKAAHHGSRYSNSRELLEAVRPELAVISYKEGNSYGHPHEEAIERMEQAGCRILKTGEQGAVFLHAEGETLQYWTYLQSE